MASPRSVTYFALLSERYLRYSSDVAHGELIDQHKVMADLRRRHTVSPDFLWDHVKVQRRRTFDVRKVVAEVVRVSVEARIQFFRFILHAQFASGIEWNVHLAV